MYYRMTPCIKYIKSHRLIGILWAHIYWCCSRYSVLKKLPSIKPSEYIPINLWRHHDGYIHQRPQLVINDHSARAVISYLLHERKGTVVIRLIVQYTQNYTRYNILLEQCTDLAIRKLSASIHPHRVICGLLRDKLVILVTHQLQYAERADRILAIEMVCVRPD